MNNEININNTEIWVTVKNFDNYEVSNLGRIRNKKFNKMLATKKINYEYKRVHLANSNEGVTVSLHRLIATTFIPNPYNLPEINHINTIKDDNRVENLEWCDRKYNANHADIKEKISKSKKGTHSSKNGLVLCMYGKNGDFLDIFDSANDAERKTKGFLKSRGISRVVTGVRKTYKNCYFIYANYSNYPSKYTINTNGCEDE